MRPEYLIMSGFGPYAGKTEIDFGKLGESGLYLITGDTGAGKTTIFDAISYALYGEASGQVRDPGMFRSKYAAPETPTYVELRFAYQGRSYTVRRNPEYIRPKGRGTGTTVQKAEAELLFPDGRPPVTKAREVTRAVTELTGLDYRQFTQIAMIAQGDFQKLLLAGTAERGEIFRQIFHTGLYQEIQKRLKDAARDKWQQYDELRRSISQFLDGVDAGQDPALCQEFEELKKEHFDGRAVRGMEILERLLELDGKQVSELEGQLLELDKAIETENGRLNGVQQRRELERSLAEKQEELARLSGSISDAAGREEDCRKQAERCPELEEGIRAAGRQLEQLLELERQSGICRERGQALLKAGQEKETWARTAQEAKAAAGERALELEKLQGAEAEAVTLRAKAGETERRLGELKDGLDGWQKAEQLVLSMEEEMKALSEKKNGHRLETEETKKLWDTVKDAELSLAELEKEELRLFSEKERQEQLSARVKNRTELLERLEKKQQEYRQAAEEYGCLRARYEQLEQLFFDGQAGILAGRLEEGKPCPVCGAVHHPAPAVPLEGAPEKDELDQEKRKVEKAAELAQKLSGDAGHLLEALEKEEQLLSQAGTELYQDGAPDHMERRLELEAEELSGRQEDCRRRQEQAKKDKQKKEELTERMEVLEQQQEKLEADEKALSGRLAAGRAAAEERKKRLEELAGDAEQAASVLAGLQQAGEKLQAELEANSLRRKEKAQLEGLLETDRSRQEEAERSMHQSELQMTALQTELSAAKAQEETLKGQLEKLLGQGETPGEAREALNSQITGWTKEKQRLEQEYKAAGEECRRLQMARAGAAQASETLKSQLKALEELKEEEILAALETLKAEKEQRAAVFRDRYAAEKKNREIYQSVSSRRTAMEEAEQEYAWIRGLSDTANGTLNGKQKIELETYVQMSYFDRILRRANLRFLTMSSGQYELKRREEVENRREKAGLELNVIDHYNGSERSVKTLSGGESFQASLSLALGLSDEIQARAGGIRLDAMFVDEGFGSLDEDALNQAMKALEGLTEGNRLVGIISHVAELKERIESKILVTRTRNGGGAGSRAEVAGRQTPEPFILF